ncbi:hypothetical protein ACQ4PT_019712 [Festuca glaucescens]
MPTLRCLPELIRRHCFSCGGPLTAGGRHGMEWHDLEVKYNCGGAATRRLGSTPIQTTTPLSSAESRSDLWPPPSAEISTWHPRNRSTSLSLPDQYRLRSKQLKLDNHSPSHPWLGLSSHAYLRSAPSSEWSSPRSRSGSRGLAGWSSDPPPCRWQPLASVLVNVTRGGGDVHLHDMNFDTVSEPSFGTTDSYNLDPDLFPTDRTNINKSNQNLHSTENGAFVASCEKSNYEKTNSSEILSANKVSNNSFSCSDEKDGNCDLTYPLNGSIQQPNSCAPETRKRPKASITVYEPDMGVYLTSDMISSCEGPYASTTGSLQRSNSCGKSTGKGNMIHKKPPYPQGSAKASVSTSNNLQACAGISKLGASKVEVLKKPSKFLKTSLVGLINDNKRSKVLFRYEDLVKFFQYEVRGISPRGLFNCGNSCYANAVLQCLMCTKPLMINLLLRLHSKDCCSKNWCLMCELEQYASTLRESGGPVSPSRILSNLRNIGYRLGGGSQEDAHEFLRHLVMSMQAACLDGLGGEKQVEPSLQETTLIQQMFGGRLKSKVKCLRCHHESERYENIMDLTLEIHGWVESLQDALTQFTSPEDLDGENMYKCGRCCAYVKARKQLSVHEVPNILTVVLKRFQVKAVSLNQVMSEGAYMLFYLRSFPRPPRIYIEKGLLPVPSSSKRQSSKSSKGSKQEQKQTESLLASDDEICGIYDFRPDEEGYRQDQHAELRSRNLYHMDDAFTDSVSTDFSDATSSEWSLFNQL